MAFKSFSLLLLAVGIFLLVQIAAPFFSYKSKELLSFGGSIGLVNPIVDRSKILGVSVENYGDFPALIVKKDGIEPPYESFTVDIPKIKLTGSRVLVYTNDFEFNLASLPGTAMPGERGNVFVTGHSSINVAIGRQGAKPIFANLPNLKKDDEIYVNALGQRYTYTVTEIKVVDPKDVSVINSPDDDGRYLTLMTCVPPGFNTKRLVVSAKLK